MRKITGLGFAAALMLTAAPLMGVLALPAVAVAQSDSEAARQNRCDIRRINPWNLKGRQPLR